MQHKPTLHQTTSNQSANIYSSLTNACKKRGTKELKKKISSCNSAAHGLEKDTGQKSSKHGCGGRQTDRQLRGEEEKLKEKMHRWELLMLTCKKKVITPTHA